MPKSSLRASIRRHAKSEGKDLPRGLIDCEKTACVSATLLSSHKTANLVDENFLTDALFQYTRFGGPAGDWTVHARCKFYGGVLRFE